MSRQDWLAARASRNPNHPALIYTDHMWSYRELNQKVAAAAGFLADHQVKNGDHIAILLQNNLEHILLVFACMRLGAVLVPLNTRLTPTEIALQLKIAQCSHLVADLVNLSVLEPFIEGGIQRIEIERLQEGMKLPYGSIRPEGLENYLQGRLRPDQVQGILFTSGSTGRPKGVVLSYGNHLWSSYGSMLRLGAFPQDRWGLILPLYHIGGLAIVFRAVIGGHPIVLESRFDPQRLSELILHQQVSLISMVPTMFQRWLETETGAFEFLSLRHLLLGGARARPELVHKALDLGLPIALTYGMTETASQAATALTDQIRRKPGSVGRPLFFNAVEIQSPEGAVLAPEEEGEIVIHGPNVMNGYLTAAGHERPFTASGGFPTGDFGYVDREGDLWILDRGEDRIVSGGENISPAEVEVCLTSHPDILTACVFGVADNVWGQAVAAVVATTRITEDDIDILLDYCRRYLAGYKIPRYIQIVESLPLTGAGKIDKRAVKANFILEYKQDHSSITNP